MDSLGCLDSFFYHVPCFGHGVIGVRESTMNSSPQVREYL